jgi:hypothetical protein
MNELNGIRRPKFPKGKIFPHKEENVKSKLPMGTSKNTFYLIPNINLSLSN